MATDRETFIRRLVKELSLDIRDEELPQEIHSSIHPKVKMTVLPNCRTVGECSGLPAIILFRDGMMGLVCESLSDHHRANSMVLFDRYGRVICKKQMSGKLFKYLEIYSLGIACKCNRERRREFLKSKDYHGYDDEGSHGQHDRLHLGEDEYLYELESDDIHRLSTENRGSLLNTTNKTKPMVISRIQTLYCGETDGGGVCSYAFEPLRSEETNTIISQAYVFWNNGDGSTSYVIYLSHPNVPESVFMTVSGETSIPIDDSLPTLEPGFEKLCGMCLRAFETESFDYDESKDELCSLILSNEERLEDLCQAIDEKYSNGVADCRTLPKKSS